MSSFNGLNRIVRVLVLVLVLVLVFGSYLFDRWSWFY